MSFRYTINPRRRLNTEDFIGEWEAGNNSPYGLHGCCMTGEELLRYSGNYRNFFHEAKKRGYCDKVSWENINLHAKNIRLQMDNDDLVVEIDRLKTQIALLNKRLDGDVKPNEVMSAIRKERFKNEQ